MASNQTQHYQLSQWEASDKVERLDFNGDNAKIDAALHGLARQVAGKAESSAVSSLASLVNTKADQSALTAAEQAHAADIAALRGALPWVALGEAALAAEAPEVSVTVPNLGQYQQISLYYRVSGPKIMYLSWNGAAAGQLTRVDYDITMMAGKSELSRIPGGGCFCSSGMWVEEGSKGSITNSSRFYAATLELSGTAQIGIRASTGNLGAGSRVTLYGLKK